MNICFNFLNNFLLVKRNRPCLGKRFFSLNIQYIFWFVTNLFFCSKEPCLKEFLAQIDEQPNTININVNDTLYGSFHDGNIPFPKTCGARFSGPNLLVCFSRPTTTRLAAIESKSNVTPTPKALSALSHYLNSSKKLNSINTNSSQTNLTRNSEALPNIFPISVSSFYTANRSSSTGKVRHKSAKNKPVRNSNWKCLPVYIYDAEKILPCNKYLAENYM